MNGHSYNSGMDNKIIDDITSFLKDISDSTRLKILISLLEDEKCVCKIANELNISHSLASHQLAYLRKANLVKMRKEKRHTFYKICDDHVKELIHLACVHITEKQYDKENL